MEEVARLLQEEVRLQVVLLELELLPLSLVHHMGCLLQWLFHRWLLP